MQTLQQTQKNILASLDMGHAIQAQKHECFINCALVCLYDSAYHFVYGWVALSNGTGVLVAEHCWLLNDAGEIVDPTAIHWVPLMQHARYFSASVFPGHTITLSGYTMPFSDGIPVNSNEPAKQRAMIEAHRYKALLEQQLKGGMKC